MDIAQQIDQPRGEVLIQYDPDKHGPTNHYYHKHGYIDNNGSYHTKYEYHYHGTSYNNHDPTEHDNFPDDNGPDVPGGRDVLELRNDGESAMREPHGDDPR